MLAVKSRKKIKITKKIYFFAYIFLLFQNIGGNEVGQKQKTEKREKKRPKVGDNNGQAMHGAHKPPGPKERESESW